MIANSLYRIAGESQTSLATVRAFYSGKPVRPAMAAAIIAAARRLGLPEAPEPNDRKVT